MLSRRALAAALPGLVLAAPESTPFAHSVALERYWPVVTDHERWDWVSREDGYGGFIGTELRRFNAPRPAARADNPTRRHVGVDLYAHAGDPVLAVEDGRLISFFPFLTAATGEMSYALMVAHQGYAANYGEVRGRSLSARNLRVGDGVRAGQAIAEISDTRQLHFETYAPGASRNASWRHGAPAPAGVLDPTALLLELARSGQRVLPNS